MTWHNVKRANVLALPSCCRTVQMWREHQHQACDKYNRKHQQHNRKHQRYRTRSIAIPMSMKSNLRARALEHVLFYKDRIVRIHVEDEFCHLIHDIDFGMVAPRGEYSTNSYVLVSNTTRKA